MVICENSLCSILFHLLVPGGRWQTADGDLQAGLGREFRQLDFPGPDPRPVGTAAVGADQQPFGVGIPALADGVPPAAERSHSERGGVVVGADRHPSGVRGHVVDSVRDRFSEFLVRKVVHVHRFR